MQPNAKGDRRSLPRHRPLAPDHRVRRDDAQGMKRMIDRSDQAVAPGALVDLLGMADVPQAIGEAGLRVPQPPGQEERGSRHEQADPESMLKRGHGGSSSQQPASCSDCVIPEWKLSVPVGPAGPGPGLQGGPAAPSRCRT